MLVVSKLTFQSYFADFQQYVVGIATYTLYDYFNSIYPEFVRKKLIYNTFQISFEKTNELKASRQL